MLRTISYLRSSLSTIPYTLSRLSHPLGSSNPLFPASPIPQNPFFHSAPNLHSPFSNSQLLQRRHQSHGDESNRNPTGPPRLFVVQPRLRPEYQLKGKLDEALNLANSLEEQRDGYYESDFYNRELAPHIVVQNPAARSPRADTYFGPGTVDTIRCHINALESKDGLDAVFVNAILTGIQQRNLERAWRKPVLDRVGLIIEIFNAHAQTKEAKLQAELAALMYKRTRLVRVRGPDGRYTFGAVGEAEVVSARGRGSGGRGFISGAGETELQLQRRRILERRNQLLSEIKEVRRTRALQRVARRRHGCLNGEEIATIAVVGYTNAGKSTLVSALSDSDLYCDDRLFATVDPKLRSVILPSGRKVLLSDTVGFISDLPVQLVEAFHATLEEVVEADLLVHVLDSSAPDLDEHRDIVLQVLQQIGVPEEKLQNMIEVWNKIDLQEDKICSDEYGDGDEVGSFSDEEDNAIMSNQLCEDVHDQDVSGDMNMDDKQNAESDGWITSEDEQNLLVDYKSNSSSLETLDEHERVSFEQWSSSKKDPSSQYESVHYVKTSAVNGVGLQELLELIDERLRPQKFPETSFFDRKWRPPHPEGVATAND